jgi:hypothetical protein
LGTQLRLLLLLVVGMLHGEDVVVWWGLAQWLAGGVVV